jgi:hypothetical protein
MPQHRTPEQDDLLVQSGVLTLVLSEVPTVLTLTDVVKEVGAESGEMATTQAVRELTALGLLHREGSLVLPTRAALQFNLLAA